MCPGCESESPFVLNLDPKSQINFQTWTRAELDGLDVCVMLQTWTNVVQEDILGCLDGSRYVLSRFRCGRSLKVSADFREQFVFA